MKKISLIVLIIFSLSTFFFAETGNWLSFETGIQKAKEVHKPVLIDFFADWCHWCKVMDEKTFSDSKVAEYLKNNFVIIKLNAEEKSNSLRFKGKKMNSVQLTQAFGVKGFPSLAFLNKEQNPLTVIPGYIPPDKFIGILKYIKEEIYKNKISLNDYLKK
jgi:thioredoxin-related protein